MKSIISNKKVKILIVSIVLLLISIIIGLMVGCSDNKQIALLNMKKDVESSLENEQINFREVVIDYRNTIEYKDEEFEFYDLTVVLDDSEVEYETIWEILTMLDNRDLDYMDYNVGFLGYVEYLDAIYSLKTKYEIWKKNDSFSYITNTLHKPELPYVGMSEDLIDYTLLGKYAKKDSKVHDVEHRHYTTYYYTFYKDNITYRVACEHGKVVSVTEFNK